MRLAKDAGELTDCAVNVTMALENLRTMGHFEALAGGYSNAAFKEVRESKIRRYVVTVLAASENWRDFMSAPSGEARSQRRFSGPWQSPARRLRLSGERARAITAINRAWHTNVLAPLLVVYPQIAANLSGEAAQKRGQEIAELESDPGKLRRAIDALPRAEGVAYDSGDSPELGDAGGCPSSEALPSVPRSRSFPGGTWPRRRGPYPTSRFRRRTGLMRKLSRVPCGRRLQRAMPRQHR